DRRARRGRSSCDQSVRELDEHGARATRRALTWSGGDRGRRVARTKGSGLAAGGAAASGASSARRLDEVASAYAEAQSVRPMHETIALLRQTIRDAVALDSGHLHVVDPRG